MTSWLLFIAVLTNQAGRVLVPAIKTSVLADPAMGPEFKEVVGAQLATCQCSPSDSFLLHAS